VIQIESHRFSKGPTMSDSPVASNSTPFMRIGQGWDTHRLVEGRPLVLGGVTIPFTKGLLGHSDADALLHAITDAILGAAALGDIGTLFPDTAAEFKNADSWQLLQQAGQSVADVGWKVVNIDCTVVAQAPKLAPYKSQMALRIAQALELDVNQVNVKAKTAEGMGPVGEGLSIETQAIALLQKSY
jgi:2-C-methyl-D-erythritol 2,4-cyclodiphosphate synthase